jgi:hypothetical protein
MATKEELLGTGIGSIDEVIKIAPDGVPLDPNKTQGRKHRQLLKDMLAILAAGETLNVYDVTPDTKALLRDPDNWDINGTYTGAAITGTIQGMRVCENGIDVDYFYEAIENDVWVRLIKG